MRILLLDENKGDMARLEDYTFRYANQLNVKLQVDMFTSPDDFLHACEEPADKPYLVIINIALGEVNGISVARKMRENGNNARLLFTDTTENHAMDAFGVMADGYLTKPISYEDFSNAMNRFLHRFAKESDTIEIRAERSKVKLHTAEILFAESSGHSVTIYCKKGTYKTTLSMNELLGQIREVTSFLNCGRSYLVNMKYIRTMEKEVIEMDDGHTIPIPVRLRKELTEKYREYRHM